MTATARSNAPAGLDVLALGLVGAPVADVPMYHSGAVQAARSGATIEVVEPATGRLIARIPHADGTDLDLAVTRAEQAQREWARVPVPARADIVRRLADRVAENAERFGDLDARDNGSPWREMHADALKGVGALRYMAGLGMEMKGDTIPVRPNGLHMTTLEPWGVVARIIAFNHPALFACGRLAPALVAGNAVVLKPSELASLSALALAQLADDLLPSGLLSVLTGGPVLGQAIAAHPTLRRLSFTGSVATALKISAAAAGSGVVKTTTFELGGKNPIIVFPDADLEAAADAVVRGMNFTRVQGQSCGSTSRLIVHRSIAADVLDRVVELARAVRIGSPNDRTVDMGAMITTAARDRCLAFVERAVRDGARLVLGGTPPTDPQLQAGAFMLPTILTGVDPASELAQTEVFGPVLAVHEWDEVEQAIELANGVRYGLTASIWTRDISAALRTAGRVEAGYLWINDVETRYPAVPFGGWKDSGSGLEHGIEELISFTRTKAINVAFG